MLPSQKIKFGAQPIIWSNDDFRDLGGETSLETCLEEMREAGYVGTELGHKFPKDPKVLKPLLQKYGLELITGWHSTYLAEGEFSKEKQAYLEHLNFLDSMGSSVVIVAECSKRIYHRAKGNLALQGEAKLSPKLSDDEWEKLCRGLEIFSHLAADRGMKLAYHYHMGTVIQNLPEIDRLVASTSSSVGLVGDTGHAAFAGIDPLELFQKYRGRIAHIHLKNIRPSIVRQARQEGWTFERSVKAGVFTVPGDVNGGINYLPIFRELQETDYQGWWVVEAEQDPQIANPLESVRLARAYLGENLSRREPV